MSVHPLAPDGYPIGPALRRGLTLLAKAKSLAADVGHDVWDFAVEADRLRSQGLTDCDLRWLTCRGLVRHAREADPRSPRRWFTGPGGLNFPPGSCFVLTDQGAAFVTKYHTAPPMAEPAQHPPAGRLPVMLDPAAAHGRAVDATGAAAAAVTVSVATSSAPTPDRPNWDAARRELRIGGRLVKRFRVPAPVQELILTAFEEEGWPPRVDDPLPVSHDLEPKRRLQSAILSLNRNRRVPLVRFHGDGNGLGICWNVVARDDCRTAGTPRPD